MSWCYCCSFLFAVTIVIGISATDLCISKPKYTHSSYCVHICKYNIRISISSTNKSIKYRKYSRNNTWGLNAYVLKCVFYFRFLLIRVFDRFVWAVSTVIQYLYPLVVFRFFICGFVYFKRIVGLSHFINIEVVCHPSERYALKYTHTLVDGFYHNNFFFFHSFVRSLVHTLQFFHIGSESLLFSLKLVVTFSSLPFLFYSLLDVKTNSIYNT